LQDLPYYLLESDTVTAGFEIEKFGHEIGTRKQQKMDLYWK